MSRACVRCGHAGINQRGFCVATVPVCDHGRSDSIMVGQCGCKCDFPPRPPADLAERARAMLESLPVPTHMDKLAQHVATFAAQYANEQREHPKLNGKAMTRLDMFLRALNMEVTTEKVTRLRERINDALSEVQADERERAARVAEDANNLSMVGGSTGDARGTAKRIAAAIRALGEGKESDG